MLPLAMVASSWSILTPKVNTNNVLAQIKTVDPNATKQTKALFANLKKISAKQIMFGHQDDLAYGYKWNDWHKKKSDVKDVCGRYPAVFGWDISKLGQGSKNLDHVEFKNMRKWILEAYKMGGLNTMSWHVDNFVSRGNAWDNQSGNVVAAILPGGAEHENYKARLDIMAAFFKSLRKGFLAKHEIPIVFRPFHEHTGSWFWWGQPNCSPDEYKQLWQFTVKYLRDEKGIHNLLYCYSPDVFRDKEHYLECYPGDEYVDIMGLDDYHDVNPKNDPVMLTKRLRMLVELAEEHGKVAALTETGLEGIPEARWWTDHLLKNIKADPVASNIAWVLVWRNANNDHDRPNHHYAPYPGHSSAPNFLEFCDDPVILMEGELPKLYRLN